jgi:PAS domain S-box-containing protein
MFRVVRAGKRKMRAQGSKIVSTKQGCEAFSNIDQSALDAIPTGFCVCRVDGALVRYNKRAVELWGRTPRLGDTGEFSEINFRRYTAQGLPLPFAASPVAVALRSGVPVRGVELLIERPDGSQVPVLMSAAPLKDAEGHIDGAICSFQELTERKRAEEALRASEAELQSVINRTPFMLVRCGRDLRYRFVSEAYAHLIDCERDAVIGKSIDEVIGARGLRTLQPFIDAVLQGETVDFECDLEFPRSGVRRLAIAYRPELDPAGNVEGWIASLLDITDQRSGEEARRQLASIVESSDDAIVSKDLNGVIISWNPGAERLFGYSAEDMIGKPITTIIPDHLKGEEPQILERVRAGARVEHYETIRRCKDGRLVDVSLTVSPMRDEHGTIIGASKIARDVTARKRAEAVVNRRADEQAALYRFTNRLYRAESIKAIYEAALDAIMDAMHCGRASILRCDTDGIMRFVAWRGLSEGYRRATTGDSPWALDDANPEPVCMTGIDRAELDQPLKSIVKQEGIGALAFIPLMAEGRLVGKFMVYYDTPQAFDGEAMELALTLARQLGFAIERMRAEQARLSIQAELRMLSERLEEEVERRTLERDRIWNVSEDLLAVSNFEGYFLSINPAWTRLLGWTDDEIKSMHVSELRHPEDAPASIAGRAQLAHGATTVRMENRFRHKDGSWRWLQWTMTASKGLLYVAGRHVTAEKEAAAALERAQRQTAHLQKMDAIGQLTGGIAHDFNNLLMIVSGHAQGLKKRLKDAKDVRALQAIEMAAARGENLTRQLLSFSRTLPLSPTVINAAEAVHAIRDVLAGSMHVNIQFQIDVPKSTWPICVDKSELELALVNLAVTNHDRGGKRPRPSRRLAGRHQRRFRRTERSRYRQRHPARSGVPCGRAVLHHQGAKQGHRAWPVAGLWLRAPVRRDRRDHQRGRSRHQSDRVPAAQSRGAGDAVAAGRGGLCRARPAHHSSRGRQCRRAAGCGVAARAAWLPRHRGGNRRGRARRCRVGQTRRPRLQRRGAARSGRRLGAGAHAGRTLPADSGGAHHRLHQSIRRRSRIPGPAQALSDLDARAHDPRRAHSSGSVTLDAGELMP